MDTIFDIYSIALLLASLTIFVSRYITEEPPTLPYLVIACTCAVGNWLGEAGAEMGAIVLMTAASFLFLSCLLYPRLRRSKSDDLDA
ncbi:MAG: XrtV sorting system accessory protein [Parvularculaceae bacterium]